MAKLLFLPVAERIQSGTYLLYDGSCGTGGMLTVAEETLREKAELADLAQTQAALMRALARLRVAEKRGRRGRGGAPRPGG